MSASDTEPESLHMLADVAEKAHTESAHTESPVILEIAKAAGCTPCEAITALITSFSQVCCAKCTRECRGCKMTTRTGKKPIHTCGIFDQDAPGYISAFTEAYENRPCLR
jgi:hypothetical protein